MTYTQTRLGFELVKTLIKRDFEPRNQIPSLRNRLVKGLPCGFQRLGPISLASSLEGSLNVACKVVSQRSYHFCLTLKNFEGKFSKQPMLNPATYSSPKVI